MMTKQAGYFCLSDDVISVFSFSKEGYEPIALVGFGSQHCCNQLNAVDCCFSIVERFSTKEVGSFLPELRNGSKLTVFDLGCSFCKLQCYLNVVSSLHHDPCSCRHIGIGCRKANVTFQ